MSRNSQDYVTALFGFDAVVQRVGFDQWDAPSPCEGWTAFDVLDHNIGVTKLLVGMATGNPAAVPATGGVGEVAVQHGEGLVWASWVLDAFVVLGDRGDPVGVWNQHRDAVVDALDQPAVLFADAKSPWDHPNVDSYLGMAFYDPLVHTWDLAKAVGQAAYLDPRLVDRALDFLSDPGEGRNLRAPRALKEPVPTNRTDAVARLIAGCGRNPDHA